MKTDKSCLSGVSIIMLTPDKQLLSVCLSVCLCYKGPFLLDSLNNGFNCMILWYYKCALLANIVL